VSVDSNWDDLMISLGLEPSTPRISPLALLAHPPVPCGTVPGYNRHNTNGETPCRACKDAKNAAQNARRAAKRPPKPVSLKKTKPPRTAPKLLGPPPAPREHGTPRGARQHWKYREPVCDACRDAYNAWQNGHRASDQVRTLRLPDDRRRQVESLLWAGHSDWSVHRQTGVARTTIARYRKDLGLSGHRADSRTAA
jgi:hypothetical protein